MGRNQRDALGCCWPEGPRQAQRMVSAEGQQLMPELSTYSKALGKI